jgi:hypothetical protein
MSYATGFYPIDVIEIPAIPEIVIPAIEEYTRSIKSFIAEARATHPIMPMLTLDNITTMLTPCFRHFISLPVFLVQ